MDIGIIADALNSPSTGVGNYTKNLINGLQHTALGDDTVSLINSREVDAGLFPTIVIPNPFPVLKTYAWYLYLTKKLQKYDLAVIHNPTQAPTYFRLKQKYVLTVHDITTQVLPESHTNYRVTIYKELFPKTLKTADKIIAVSNHTKQDLIKYYGIPEDNIQVIYEAADSVFKPPSLEEKETVARRYNLNFPYILYVGTLEPRKNILILIKAFEMLKEADAGRKLVITGKKGWKYDSIFEYIAAKDLHRDVIFTGYVPNVDLPGLYNSADLLAYPSQYEGFGLPPLEAMACGCPVITSNTSSLPEVVGDAGIQIDPGNPKLLADAMLWLLNDDSTRKEFVRKGLERSKQFGWKKCAEETLQIFREVQGTGR